MEFKLNTPLAFSEIGQKPNQEDRICPGITDLNANDRCFVLCDGMGGHEHGEVAAEIVATTLQPELMSGKPAPDVMTVDRFKKALAVTYTALDKMPVDEGKRPGTTMTCLYFAENGAFVAHIGDSRVYQVRPGQGVVFKTSDHSLVNELLKAGEITEEGARTFPRKNVITRAMQPRLDTPYKADTSVLTDVRAGDFFFMCTDGILENITDEKLVEILSHDETDEKKLEEIYTECYARTRDNFTCILVPVAEVRGEPLPTPQPVVEPVTVKAAAQNPAPKTPQTVKTATRRVAAPTPVKNKFKTLAIAFGIIAVLAIGAAVYFALFNDKATVPAQAEGRQKTEVAKKTDNEVKDNQTSEVNKDTKADEQPDEQPDKQDNPGQTGKPNNATITEGVVEAGIEEVTNAIDKNQDVVKPQDIQTSTPTPSANGKQHLPKKPKK